MNKEELISAIKSGALNKYADIYRDIEKQSQRYIEAIEKFASLYGADREISVFSVPGRSEISGNHTDHNQGCVLAGAVDRDIIAVVAKNDDGIIRFQSEGYPLDTVETAKTENPDAFKNYTSASLIAGMVNGFSKSGYNVGGFDAYATSEVLKGSGISSSAAYEVMIGNILNHLYNGGVIDNKEIAKLAKYAENVYFGKPSGLMDQMACAVGGFVYIDFENNEDPIVESIDFSLKNEGYSLCIVNTGGNHADLNDDYASVPQEMKTVAKLLGRDALRGLCEEDIIKNIGNLRRLVGDRAILRAIHFIRENKRVTSAREALNNKETDTFFGIILASGKSSFEYLQNVYTTQNIKEQGLSLALAITEGFLSENTNKKCAYRVHGGGFAGTIQAFVPDELCDKYIALMDSVFGDNACQRFNIRPVGAVKIL
jgi:galactokinase